MRIVKFDDSGLTNECPDCKVVVPIRICHNCKFHLGTEGFDVRCGYKSQLPWNLIIRISNWRKKHKLKIGLAQIFTAGLVYGLMPALALPVWATVVWCLWAALFIIDGKNMVLADVLALEKQLKEKK